MRINRSGLGLILLAAITWGTTGLTSKILNQLSALDAVSVGALRLLIAFPALLVLAQALAPGALWPLLKREWRAVGVMGAMLGGAFAAVAAEPWATMKFLRASVL